MPPKDSLLAAVANLCHAWEETNRHRGVGQHPVPIAGKQGRALLARSQPAWEPLLSGTALSFRTSTDSVLLSCPFHPAVRLPGSASAGEATFPATKLLSQAGILPFL